MHLMLSLPSTNVTPPSNPQTPFSSSTDSIRLLNSCASQRNLNLTISLHAAVAKSGLLSSNLIAANSLLDSYSKCGHLNYAHRLFDQMPQRDIVSWTSLISGYCRDGSPYSALSVFVDLLRHEDLHAPNEFTIAAVVKACSLTREEKVGQALHGYVIKNGFLGDSFVSNSLIDMYSKMGSISNAKKSLVGFSRRDVVSWSSVISGCVLCEMYEKALVLFSMMLEDGVEPNLVTLLSIIHACSLKGEVRNFGCAHAWVMKLGLGDDALAASSLMEMYSKNGLVNEALKIMIHSWDLNGIGSLDPDAIAALIHSCTISGCIDCGKEIHGLLIKQGVFPWTIIENALMDLYAKNEHVASANSIFQRMENRDIVSWNTMISCFAKSENASKALDLLNELHANKSGRADLMPDFISMLSSIQGCSEIASLQQGQILHAYSIRSGLNCDIFTCNALIDMYANSGRIDFSKQIFNEMNPKDIGSWNSMIQAYGIHGDGHSVIRTFTQLKKSGKLTPNAITFVSVISACGHSGLTKEGYECFKSMRRDYGIEPTMEHYASMVDLLARSGKLNEAEKFINDMPIKASSAIWGSLLGSCGIFVNIEIAERAAGKLAVLEPDGIVWRVALSNVYASAGRWEDVGKLRGGMKMEGVKKEAGWSSVEVNGGRFRFIVGDTRHSETERVYELWNCIKKHSLDIGDL